MSLLLEYHLIQSFVPSNLNRDDTGSPKDAIFGGYRRARVSSQSWKRAMRKMFNGLDLAVENIGIRTKKLKSMLVERLSGMGGEDEIEKKVEAALAAAGLKLEEDGKTQYLLFLGEREVASFAELVRQQWDLIPTGTEKKGKKESKSELPKELVSKAKGILNGGKAVDVALFGRMLADMPEANQDAACQVAHALSTHRVEREFDYFTAVDDMGTADESGAGMIGYTEFNSATFYRYAALDVNKLVSNLQQDRELALSGIEAFTKAMVLSIPSGKQNSFAAHNPPSFVGICLKRGIPISLANAFENPVRPTADASLSEQSVRELSGYDKKVSHVYGSSQDKWVYLDLTSIWDRGEKVSSLSELVWKVRSLIESELQE